MAALFLYFEPQLNFANTDPRDLTRLVLFVSGSTFISWICGSLRASNRRAAELVQLREEALSAEQKARAEVEQKQEQLTANLKSMTDVFIALDSEWRYVYVNPRGEELINKRFEEVAGRIVWDVFPDAMGTLFETESRRALQEGTSLEYEEFLPSVQKWFAVRIYPSVDGGTVYYCQDITARRQAEEDLRRNEELLATTLRSIGDAVITTDRAGHITFMNPAAEAVTGWNEAEVKGRPVEEVFNIIDEETRNRVDSPVASVLRDGMTVELANHTILIAKDGHEVPIENSGAPIAHLGGKIAGVVLVFRDVTEKRRVETEAARLTALIDNQRQHLQAVVASVPGIVWETWGQPDKAGQRLDFVSDYVETMLGYSVEQWLSTPQFWHSIVHDEDKERATSEAAAIFAGGKGGASQFRLVTKDGSILWVEARSVVITDDHGNPIGMRGVTMDITPRKQKEASERFLAEAGTALASSLEYEETLSNVARLAVPQFADWCAVDIRDSTGKLNRLAVAHVDPYKIRWAYEIERRYPTETAAPNGIYNVLRTGRSEFYPDVRDEMLVQSARDDEHLRILRQIGFRSVMIVPLKAWERALGVMIFVNSDSNRHHTEEDLHLAEELAHRAALAVDNAQLYRMERETRKAAEETSERLTRLQSLSGALSQAMTAEEVARAVIEQGLAYSSADAGIVVLSTADETELEIVQTVGFPNEVDAEWKRFPADARVPIAEAVRSRSPVILESSDDWSNDHSELGPLQSVTGTRALTAFPLIVEGRAIGALGWAFPKLQKFNDDDHAFMLALAQQCAQALRRAGLYETELRLRTEAETANRIKDEFLATVSHELRTPLTAIVGWSSMLRGKSLDSTSAARALETIERNAKAQNRIIEDLLDVSRIITGKLRLDAVPTEITPIVEMALEVIRPTAISKQITVSATLDWDTGVIFGDPARVQQMLWNLLSNAVKFTPAGGQVDITLRHTKTHAQIIIKDTGPGINSDFLPFIFDRFRQADGSITRTHGGLGLGLAIVRHLAEMHGGSVRAESGGLGKGATFILELPLVTTGLAGFTRGEISTSTSYTPEVAQATSLTGADVLIIEDEADTRHLLKEILEQAGAIVRTGTSAAEARTQLAQREPDILISDIGMPDEDGYSLIQSLRELRSGMGATVPAIAMTAYVSEEDRMRALLAGFQVHLAKPVNPVELIGVVSALLEAKTQD
jgi:PAS domain S-box-containing protein